MGTSAFTPGPWTLRQWQRQGAEGGLRNWESLTQFPLTKERKLSACLLYTLLILQEEKLGPERESDLPRAPQHTSEAEQEVQSPDF